MEWAGTERGLFLGMGIVWVVLCVLYSLWTEYRLRKFVKMVLTDVNDIIEGRERNWAGVLFRETLLSKTEFHLKRLAEITKRERERLQEEREELLSLISDISHQVKTPTANIRMIADTLRETDLSGQQKENFFDMLEGQIEKLNFLMQSMVKSSRLENGVIQMNKRLWTITHTIAKAIGGVVLKAEQKAITIEVDCPREFRLFYDERWMEEVLFNLLDNAVKYTEYGGKVWVQAEKLELYTKISVRDTGKGIKESRQAQVFKRFYREPEVYEKEGIGIGLYLVRKIVTMQNGYVQVHSEEGKGSEFMVFLPNRERGEDV